MKSPFVASNIQRAYLCPPSVWRELDAPKLPREAQAQDGVNYHSLVEEYWHSGTEAYGTGLGCVWAVVKMLKELMAEHGCDTITFEQQLRSHILNRNCYLDALLTGPEDAAVVVDFKFWRNKMPFDAAHDAQLLTYVLALAHDCPMLQKVVAVRFHPFMWDEGRVTAVEYVAPFDEWESRLHKIMDRSNADSPAVPGDYQCKYCRAKSVCPEWLEWANNYLPTTISNNLPAAQVADLLAYRDRVKMMASVMSEVEKMARQLLEAGEDVPGYVLKEGKKRRSIPDAQMAFERLSSVMSSDGFAAACTVSQAKLAKAFKALTGLNRKAAEERLAELLDGVIELKQDRPSVVEAGEDVKEIEQDE